MWPRNSRKQDGCITENESDECVAQLTDAAASLAEDWAKEPEQQNAETFGCKRVTTECLRRMMDRKGCWGYSLTHQLLYVLVAELVSGRFRPYGWFHIFVFQVGCLIVVDEYAKTMGYEDGVADFTAEFCSNVHQDLEELAKGRKPGSRKFANDPRLKVDFTDQDLFLEMRKWRSFYVRRIE